MICTSKVKYFLGERIILLFLEKRFIRYALNLFFPHATLKSNKYNQKDKHPNVSGVCLFCTIEIEGEQIP